MKLRLSEKIQQLLNEQLNKEFYSAYLYLSFADWYDDYGLRGFANWFVVQASEEKAHAMRIRTYLLDNDVKPALEPIAAPQKQVSDPANGIELAYEHECFITDSINQIYTEAVDEGDYRTKKFLEYYIAEQQEEEITCIDMMDDMKLFGVTPEGLFALDEKYGSRVAASTSAEMPR